MIFFYVAQTVFFVARNRMQLSREAWSLMARLCFLVWFMCLSWRAQQSCAKEYTDLPKTFLLPNIPFVTENLGRNNCLPTDLHLVPRVQVTFYLAELLWLLLIPTSLKRKDDTVMIAHHIITSILIIGSTYIGYYWPLALTLAIHDVADLFVDGAKFLRSYAKATHYKLLNNMLMKASSVLFYAFVIVWFATRVYYVPVHVAWYLWQSRDLHAYTTLHYVLYSIFLLVQIPQLIWTVTIGRIAVNSLCGEIKDERESQDNDEQRLDYGN